MEKTIPLQKNDTITLPIDTLGSDGQGIGRVDGYAVFVPGALPGERVRALVIKTTSGYAVAKLLEIEASAPQRIQPVCDAYPHCGGCSLQHLSYPAQLSMKKQTVQDALRKIGHLTDFEMCDTIGMKAPWRYRNKGSFPFGMQNTVQFGFFAPRSHRLVPFADCMIQHPSIVQAAKSVRAWANENRVSVYDEESHMGSLRHCMARVSKDGSVMVVVVTHGKLPHKDELLARLRAEVQGLCSVYHNRNDQRTNAIFGESFSLLWGTESMEDSIAGLQFKVSPASFLQVNPLQTEKLYITALEYLQLAPTETLIDVYCGIGTISLLAAQRCKKVLGIENVRAAVDDAESNALRNRIANASFLCGDAERLLPSLIADGLRPDAVVVDPPRKGCERAALQAIAESGARRLVYVSCNPATLARDCAYLHEMGFSLLCAQPVDMFPQTTHVECLVLMSRVKD